MFLQKSQQIGVKGEPAFGQSVSDPLEFDPSATLARLNEGTNVERLQRIQSKIESLEEAQLNYQAIRLELAVHKLSYRGYDKIAADFCRSEYEKEEY